MSVPHLDVPAAVRNLVSRLEEAGFETWTVGGAVRDALRKTARSDWDLATRATPSEVISLFRRTVPIGVDHGTVGVFGQDGVLYEVTTFRRDVIPLGRKAIVSFAETLEEDLSRRDFTINAIAWHPLRLELRDPFGGCQDLERHLLRTVGTPGDRFQEDYLRVLRGLRFAGTLDLTIDDGTWAAMVDAVPGLVHLSVERVREELVKVLSAPRPSRPLGLYQRCGALTLVAPELDRPLGSGAFATLDLVRPHRIVLRTAALILLGMADGPRREQRAGELLTRLRFSNAETDQVLAVVRGGLEPDLTIVNDPPARRRWTSEIGESAIRDVLRIWIAVLRAGINRMERGAVIGVIRDVRRDLVSGVPFETGRLSIAGRDLLEVGWTPGPEIGALLRELLSAVWRDPSLNERRALLELSESLKDQIKDEGHP